MTPEPGVLPPFRCTILSKTLPAPQRHCQGKEQGLPLFEGLSGYHRLPREKEPLPLSSHLFPSKARAPEKPHMVSAGVEAVTSDWKLAGQIIPQITIYLTTTVFLIFYIVATFEDDT